MAFATMDAAGLRMSLTTQICLVKGTWNSQVFHFLLFCIHLLLFFHIVSFLVGSNIASHKDDRPHYHSQLYLPRAHRERADWSLVRSLKLFLPLDYGPPSSRNVLPRSVVDLTKRLLSLRLGPADGQPMGFGIKGEPEGRRWRSPVDALDALQNNMVESFDLGKPKKLTLEELVVFTFLALFFLSPIIYFSWFGLSE